MYLYYIIKQWLTSVSKVLLVVLLNNSLYHIDLFFGLVNGLG